MEEEVEDMIILKTNLELKLTFERLIKTMQVPVEWNGNFVVIGDYLILHGRVRSLFFNFENKKVVTNLIDIPVKEDEVTQIKANAKVQNVLNLTLYAFGKWGNIKGLKVEQDYAQLNTLFSNVLREFLVEPGYSKENCRFYKEGIRVNYEDVIQMALEAEEKKAQEEEAKEESVGLWHKLVWKKKRAVFTKVLTTFEERQKKRRGNNFYMVGHQCPKCRENLHMVVFPPGEEFRIETEEGAVLLARAYTCDACSCFYTPRPRRLLSEGDVYVMDFFSDRHAYDDYYELLGKSGDRVSNYNFNEFEKTGEKSADVQTEKELLEDVCQRMDDLSDLELEELLEKMEEGFYPPPSVRNLEPMVCREQKIREKRHAQTAGKKEAAQKNRDSLSRASESADPGDKNRNDILIQKEAAAAEAEMKQEGTLAQEGALAQEEALPQRETAGAAEPSVSKAKQESVKKHYEAKFRVLDRLSAAQLSGLKEQLMREKNLEESSRRNFLDKIHEQEKKQRREAVHRLADSCREQSYARICRVVEEIEKEDLEEEEKKQILLPLYERRKSQGEKEVRQLLEQMPASVDLKQYRVFREKLDSYPEVDLSPYEEELNQRQKQAEEKEIAGMVRRVRANDRQALEDLRNRLLDQKFDPEILKPYLEKITDKIRDMDRTAIEEICGNPAQMGEAEAMEAYRKLEQGLFLPELKTNALEMLTKRLVKLKTDECELLVQKLKEEMQGSVKDQQKFYFYPARKVMLGEAQPEETRVIQYALDTYGTKRGTFEYPILVMDTSRDGSGKEGMILTPEHLFYHTLLGAYVVSVFDIKKVQARTGLLNAGIYLEMSDGEKIKIPYAVSRKELTEWGHCLGEFIRYLQEKPDSRKLTYLARERHETICCFRCGYSYKGGDVCPKCGYKMNQ